MPYLRILCEIGLKPIDRASTASYSNGQQCTVEGTPVHREAYQSYHSTDSNVMNDDHSCGDIESDTTNWIDMYVILYILQYTLL